MKNKIYLKKTIFKSIVVSLIFVILFLLVNYYQYRIYTKNINYRINNIIYLFKEKYPDIPKEKIINILNSNEIKSDNLFKEYGIDLDSDNLVIPNVYVNRTFIIVNICLIIIYTVILIYLYLHYNHKKDLIIKDITKTLEAINKKDYHFSLDEISEDELSILKNELYKTTIMLRENMEKSIKDKMDLKKSLEDISHQIKTPLTSILIMLDNIIDDWDMPNNIRNEFIHDIKKETTNINFLIQALLKLSKFDANTITFQRKKEDVSKIIERAIKNVLVQADLRNIRINHNECNFLINCDFFWQVEALTNILNNAIDYSSDGSEIIINLSDNKAYSKIEITNFGEEIKKEELSHLFERFYKGSNSKSNSIGIGLSLAKTIILNDNGDISVTSNNHKTTFTIKYYK